jgi:hypothetical protein
VKESVVAWNSRVSGALLHTDDFPWGERLVPSAFSGLVDTR